MGLPKLDGSVVFSSVREINAKAKVLIASGYMDPTIRAGLLDAGAKDVLQMPFDLNELLRKIRKTAR